MENNDIPLDEESYYDIFDSLGHEYLCRIKGAPIYIESPFDR